MSRVFLSPPAITQRKQRAPQAMFRFDRWLFASGRMDAEAEAGSGEDSTLAGKCFDVYGLG